MAPDREAVLHGLRQLCTKLRTGRGRMPERHVPISMGSTRSLTLELPALRISDVWFPPGAQLPEHTHDRPIFAVALEGFLDSRLPRHELSCDAASVWTEPAEERHSNRVGLAGARVVAILPDPAREELLRPCGRLLEAVHHWRHGGVASLARRMLPELRAGDAPARLAVQALALEALALGLRSGVPADADTRPPAWLMRARDILHDRWSDDLEITDLARELGVEPARLARAFRARFHLPLGTYQRRLRLDWAAEQLATTDVALGRVALRAGFYDQAHFTRHFRRHTAQTPGDYRRTHRSTQRPSPPA
jgi:AraC family transcriptional regulator